MVDVLWCLISCALLLMRVGHGIADLKFTTVWITIMLNPVLPIIPSSPLLKPSSSSRRPAIAPATAMKRIRPLEGTSSSVRLSLSYSSQTTIVACTLTAHTVALRSCATVLHPSPKDVGVGLLWWWVFEWRMFGGAQKFRVLLSRAHFREELYQSIHGLEF
jgi:hypothetical protein